MEFTPRVCCKGRWNQIAWVPERWFTRCPLSVRELLRKESNSARNEQLEFEIFVVISWLELV